MLESHSGTELLNYLQSDLTARDCIDEKKLKEIFTIISIRPENDSIIRLDLLNISTTENDNGSFARKITVRLRESDANDL